MARRGLTSALGLTVLLWMSGCGPDREPTSTSATGPGATSGTTPKPTGTVRVFAAASLTEAFKDGQAGLQTRDPGLSITFSFAGSGALATQVQQGAPADVIATADTASMKRLTDAGLVEPPTTLARNKLQILVGPGNPKGVRVLSDLARPELKVVVGDESVPFGRYATESLQKAAVTVKPVSRELDVKAAVAKVTTGEADAAVVYVTDVAAAGAKGQGVDIPEAQNVLADYPIAVVKATANRTGATAFVDAVVGGVGQDALRSRGFLPPS